VGKKGSFSIHIGEMGSGTARDRGHTIDWRGVTLRGLGGELQGVAGRVEESVDQERKGEDMGFA